jgi:hypothetical protein
MLSFSVTDGVGLRTPKQGRCHSRRIEKSSSATAGIGIMRATSLPTGNNFLAAVTTMGG